MSARRWPFSPRRFLLWAFVALLLLIALSVAASLIGFMLRGTWMPFVWPFYGFGWLFAFLFFLFFWGARWWSPWVGWGWYGRPYSHYPGDGARAILRERYARGEITKDQLDQMMRDLEQHA